MSVTGSTPITLTDGGKLMSLGGRGCKGDKAAYQVELHLYYSRTVQGSNSGCGCPDYITLWDSFLQENPRPSPLRKRRIPSALLEWHQWAEQKEAAGQLTAHKVELCYGPHRRVQTFD